MLRSGKFLRWKFKEDETERLKELMKMLIEREVPWMMITQSIEDLGNLSRQLKSIRSVDESAVGSEVVDRSLLS